MIQKKPIYIFFVSVFILSLITSCNKKKIDNSTYKWQQIGVDIDGEAAGDLSGRSVSISSDGSVVAIGAPYNDGNGENSGHVRIYKNILGNWTLIGDIDGEAAGDLSGRSVSLSSDGSTVAIGAPLNDGNAEMAGHVRIYENQSDTWKQIGQDIDGETGDRSGISVSLCDDGSIVAIGADLNDGNGESSGHVRIYENQSGTWIQIGQDIEGEEEEDRLGNSVSLSSDGSFVAIGAPGHQYAVIYENQSGVWTQIGEDIVGKAFGGFFGNPISLSSDGSIVAIGAFWDILISITQRHYVSIFENQNSKWVQSGNDINAEFDGYEHGCSVSLSSDGSVVATGMPFKNENDSVSFRVRIYKNQSSEWVQIGNDITGEAAYDHFGFSVSLSSNGRVVAIGAPYNEGNGERSGHVRVYNY